MSFRELFKKEKIKTFAKNVIIPKELQVKSETFSKEQLKALSDKRTISKLLFYRTYMEDTENDDMGLYTMGDGRIGAVFAVTPPPYLSENIENLVINALSLIVKNETVVHINAFKGRNIKDKIEEYVDLKNTSQKLNIGHPELIKDFVQNRAEYYNKWRTESVMQKDADFRIANFTHMVSILFPYDTDEFTIRQQYNQILGVLRDIGGEKLPAGKFIPILREILNPELEEYSFSNDTMTKINKQIARRCRIKLSERDGTLTLGEKGNWKAKVLTTEKFPHEVDLFTFQSAFFDPMGNDYQINLPCPFMLSLVVKFKDIEKRRKKVLSKAKWNIGQLSGLGLIVEKKMPEIKIRRQESEDVIYYIDQMGEVTLDAMFTLTVFEQNENKLDQYVGAIKKSFEQIPGRWILKEETYSQIAYEAFLMSLPLQNSEVIHDNIDRMDINFRSNNAQIAPLVGGFKGIGKPVHTYLDRTGQFMSIDYFASKTNYNICAVGPMGSGKSFFANDFHSQGLASGWDIRMIDFGRSYEKYCKTIGGQFLEFPRDNDRCLNFFTHINTKKIVDDGGKEKEMIHEDEFETLVPVVGLMLGLELRNIYKDETSTPSDKLMLSIITRFIIKGIERAFEIDGKKAGMKQVREALIEFRQELVQKEKESQSNSTAIIGYLDQIIIGLENYSLPGAPFYKYFNGTNNLDIKSKYLVTELDDIADSPIMPVIAMSILQRMAQEAFIEYLKDKKTKRVIGVDEAWRVLDSRLFVNFLEDFARRIRKYSGITMIITQRLEDFSINASAEAMFETAAWKVFLPQEAESIEKAVHKGSLSMNTFQVNLMKSAKSKKPHYNEAVIKHGDIMFIALLKVTPDDYWLFTTDPGERALIDDVMEQKDLSLSDAIWYLARKSEGYKDSEILYKLSSRNTSTKENIDWDAFFKDAIKDDSIVLSKQGIFDSSNKNEKIQNELFVKIKDTKQVYSREFFVEAAKDKGYYLDIRKKSLNKIFEYLQKQDEGLKTSINVDIFDIKDKDFKEYFVSVIDNMGEYKKDLLIEIKLDYETKENMKELISFSKDLKKHDVQIVFDNVSPEQVDLASLIEIHPKQLKINVEIVENISNDAQRKNNFKSIIYLLKQSLDVEIVFTRIENDTHIELAREFDVELIQGYALEKPILVY